MSDLVVSRPIQSLSLTAAARLDKGSIARLDPRIPEIVATRGGGGQNGLPRLLNGARIPGLPLCVLPLCRHRTPRFPNCLSVRFVAQGAMWPPASDPARRVGASAGTQPRPRAPCMSANDKSRGAASRRCGRSCGNTGQTRAYRPQTSGNNVRKAADQANQSIDLSVSSSRN